MENILINENIYILCYYSYYVYSRNLAIKKKKMDERKLMVLAKKILRKIFGPVKAQETANWNVKNNNQIQRRLFRKPNKLDTIRSNRLQWAGYD